jgi:hypothetical protein
MFLAIQARAHAFINHNYIYLSTQLMQEVLALVARLFHYLGFFPIIFCAGKNLHDLYQFLTYLFCRKLHL